MFENEFLQYVKPIGEELQHIEVSKECMFLHSDIYLLTHISEMKLSQNMLDIISNRLQQVKDDMPSDLRSQFDKLNDFDKMEFNDSRYAQWLSDRVQKTKDFMNEYDSKVSSLKDSDEAYKLKEANKALRDFVLRLSSPSGVSSSDKE